MKGSGFIQQKSLQITTAIVLGVILTACGGGDSDDGGNSDNNNGGGSATGSVSSTGGDSTLDPTSAAQLDLDNLSPNSRYQIDVEGPNGEKLSPDSGFTAIADEDGSIEDHTIVQDLGNTRSNLQQSSRSGASTSVKRSAATSGVTSRSVNPGQYEVTVQDMSGSTITRVNFAVNDNSRVYCADSSGTQRSSFTPGENAFAVVEGDADSVDGTYDVFTVSDLAGLDDGDALADSAQAGQVTVSGGQGQVDLGSFSTIGRDVDVIVDVNDNGQLDTSTDLVNRPARFHPCFTVQGAAGDAPIIGQIASDSQGNYRDVFDPNSPSEAIRDVYAWISPDQRSQIQETLGVDKYVVEHQDNWNDGDPLNDVTAGQETDPVQGSCTNESPWRVWPRQLLEPGCYDAVIDINRNGEFDAGTDFVDNIDSTGEPTCGFRVADASCADNISIESHSDGDSVDATRITLAGSVAQSDGSLPESGEVTITGGSQSSTINLSVEADGTWSADLPLFEGQNEITVAFTYGASGSDQTSCAQTLTLTSSGGTSGTANALFRAQLLWDGDTDMDLHLLRPGGSLESSNYAPADDCHYSNCVVGEDGTMPNAIDWGVSGEESDDPKLDVDCISCGEGIENIFMNEISTDGEYTVFVDAFNGDETNVRVKMFIGGNEVDTVNCGEMSSGSGDICNVGTISWSGGTSGNGTFTADGTVSQSTISFSSRRKEGSKKVD